MLREREALQLILRCFHLDQRCAKFFGRALFFTAAGESDGTALANAELLNQRDFLRAEPGFLAPVER